MLFADGFDDEFFAALAVEFGVEDLLPANLSPIRRFLHAYFGNSIA